MTDGIAETPLHLLSLARRDAEPTSEDVERLAQYLDFRTTTSAGADQDRALVVSGYPGYLSTVSGGKTIYVPFQLASVFPGEDVLGAVLQVAEDVRLLPENPICISGSTTFLGRLREVSDLDFCEYHLQDPEELPSAVAAKAEISKLAPLIEVKCDGERVHHPWTDIKVRVGTAMIAGRSPEAPAAKIKLDLVSNGPLGAMPTTSVVLPLGSDRELGNAQESFVFQEAVIDEKGPPRALLNPAGFAGYCNWLLEEARSLTTDTSGKAATVRAPKALKRLLSLLLAIGDSETVEEVLENLEAGHIHQVVRNGRIAELHDFAALAGEDVRSHIEKLARELANRHDVGSLGDAEVEEAAEITLAIGATVIEQLETRMNAMGGTR